MVITQEIFEAFLHCPTKSYLSSCTPAVAETALDRARRQWEELFRHAASPTVCTGIPDNELFVGSPTLEAIQQQKYRLILDYTLRPSDLGANGHALQLARSRRAQGQSAYIPLRFVSAEKISMTDRLLLAFDAFVFSQVYAVTPARLGKIIHGREYSTTTVPLTPLYAKVQSAIAAITSQQRTPPLLVLNKHCTERQYTTRCREITTKADDLSLFAKMSEKDGSVANREL